MTDTKLVTVLERRSRRLGKYVNNLDELLGITSEEDSKVQEFQLEGTRLHVPTPTERGGDWDWYLVDKHSKESIFKVVGLCKDGSRAVYILGKKKDSTPFLTKVDEEYLRSASVEKCLKSTEKKPQTKHSRNLVVPIVGLRGVVLVGLMIWASIHFRPTPVESTSVQSTVTTTVTVPVTTGTAATAETTDPAVSALMGIMPIVLAAMVLLGAVRALAGIGESGKE